ncbi:MAG: hypothetical protein RBG13Loki_3561 [Promethearchaeota archaeon CR_4]|nr:MAG: hypothetical protein RBG13Loki_3561 [Candidatus Lokiarchaeota archaeon CR_4]
MEKILGAKRIWTTVWDLQTAESIVVVEKMLLLAGKLSTKHRSDFF